MKHHEDSFQTGRQVAGRVQGDGKVEVKRVPVNAVVAYGMPAHDEERNPRLGERTGDFQ